MHCPPLFAYLTVVFCCCYRCKAPRNIFVTILPTLFLYNKLLCCFRRKGREVGQLFVGLVWPFFALFIYALSGQVLKPKAGGRQGGSVGCSTSFWHSLWAVEEVGDFMPSFSLCCAFSFACSLLSVCPLLACSFSCCFCCSWSAYFIVLSKRQTQKLQRGEVATAITTSFIFFTSCGQIL